LAFEHLTGPDKVLNFNSNPFAIMLKSNPGLAVDSSYYRYRALRKTNFSFGLKLDESYKFNGFTTGVKYALINQRDSSASNVLFQSLVKDNLGKEADSLKIALTRYARANIPDIPARIRFVDSVNSFYNNSIPFNKLDTLVQRIIKEIINAGKQTYPVLTKILTAKPGFVMIKEQQKVYDSLKKIIKNNFLWTIGFSDTVKKDNSLLSNILFSTRLSKGMGSNKPGSNWEYNLLSDLHLTDDSLAAGHDLKRSFFNVETGLNWVIRNKANDQSYMELFFSGSYFHNFGTLYAKEKRENLSLNATLRIRIMNDIWIPLEIKYDPRSGNVLGFLNVRFNFNGQGKNQE
jgi:hypothetical protein